MTKMKQESASRPEQRPAAGEASKRRYHSRQLFQGTREVLIEHSGYTYRLQITRQNKLILTK